MSESPVVYHEGDDPEMVAAAEIAKQTFRHFWNQVSLDFNRIVPALELACVKAPFSDDDSDGESQVEQMWVDQVNFDGVDVFGVLINEPNWLTSVVQGDEVSFPLSKISDWLCVLDGQVYGAYSVQVLRSRMSDDERTGHDEAWGLNFPAPGEVLVPARNDKFEEVLATLLTEQVEKDPSVVNSTFDEGRTVLHLEALCGRAPTIEVLLHHGADTSARCNRGWTARDYAKSLDWDHVLAILDTEM